MRDVFLRVADGYVGASGAFAFDANGDLVGVDYGVYGCFTVDGDHEMLRWGTCVHGTGEI